MHKEEDATEEEKHRMKQIETFMFWSHSMIPAYATKFTGKFDLDLDSDVVADVLKLP